MATPQVPPRPLHPKHHEQHTTTAHMEVPKIPPRPQRRSDRSISPPRDSFAPSPLNEIPFSANNGNLSGSIYSNNNNNNDASNSSLGLPPRPPSVTLPSLGQEGEEYADIVYGDAENRAENASPTQTRNVGSDLPLHAPKPSFSVSSAKARIAGVTRTDSSQAAAAGIGKPGPSSSQGDDKEPHSRPLKAKESFTRTESSASTERPGSIHVDGEHGIPEIGQRVPMYPNAGDVQAPSPSPFPQTHPTGIGFHNDGTQKPRHHGRTRSGREVFSGPPGSYGLHGHGVQHSDKFEKAWYDKHPEALVREGQGQYGPGINTGRGEWAMSSEDLNKIVRDTASRGSGFGASPNVTGLPNEQIGYMASDEYTSRMSSPRPQSSYHNKAHSNHSQGHVESPLRKASFPTDPIEQDAFDKSKDSHGSLRLASEHALESEVEDDDVIHIDPPEHRTNKITGDGYDSSTADLGPHGGNTDAEGGWIEEHGYGVPILASDEVAKEPGSEYLQPAVSPTQERRGSAYYDSEGPSIYHNLRHGSRSGSANSSRPTSRPGSIHGTLPGLARFTSHDDRDELHTPLEDVEEYEPLFPEDEHQSKSETSKPANLTDRFKHRPDMKRRFPSQDIWEDTPNSLQLQTEVNTPETELSPVAVKSSVQSEPPAAKPAVKDEVHEAEKEKSIPKDDHWPAASFKPHLHDEMLRPGMKQRFPSQDIWEDSPDHAKLETIVGDDQVDGVGSPPGEGQNVAVQAKEGATASPVAVDKPLIPPRPTRSKQTEVSADSTRAPPSLPARPLPKSRQAPPASPLSKDSSDSSPTEPRKTPALPDRPRPQLPARPAKPISRGSSEIVPPSKSTPTASVSGNDDSPKGVASPPPAPKPKPSLPARPSGGKIAALKAGFLSDLDKRLQLGPQAPPKAQEKAAEEEAVEEKEKTPLTDARKGRAKGPARRKPAASPAAPETKSVSGGLSLIEPFTVWQISMGGDLDVVHAKQAASSHVKADVPTEQVHEISVGTNAAGETVPTTTETHSHTESYSESPIIERTASDHKPVHPETAPPAVNPDNTTSVDTNPTSSTHIPATTEEATTADEATDETSSISHTGVQTGEKVITFDSTSAAPTQVIAYEGGAASEEGTVVVMAGGEPVEPKVAEDL